MKLTAQDLRDAKRQLASGPLGLFLQEKLGDAAQLSILREAASQLPHDSTASALRERALLRAVTYQELLESLPAELDELIKQQEENERTQK